MSLLDALLLDPTPFDVWIALRTDGAKGSGTQSDPYDGSTMKAAPLAVTLSNNGPNLVREAIATTGTSHGFIEGDAVTISGAAGLWNGSYPIYSVTTNGFKFWMAADPGTPAGG